LKIFSETYSEPSLVVEWEEIPVADADALAMIFVTIWRFRLKGPPSGARKRLRSVVVPSVSHALEVVPQRAVRENDVLSVRVLVRSEFSRASLHSLEPVMRAVVLAK
jgi:hypothetical protein